MVITDFKIRGRAFTNLFITTYLKSKSAAPQSPHNRNIIQSLITEFSDDEPFYRDDMEKYLDSKIWVYGENVHLNKHKSILEHSPWLMHANLSTCCDQVATYEDAGFYRCPDCGLECETYSITRDP